MTVSSEPVVSGGLDREAVISGVLDECELFAELVAGLDAGQWAAPSRCEGATTADVAGHVVGILDDIPAGSVGQRSFADHAAAFASRPPAELAATTRQLAAVVGDALAGFDDATWNGPSPLDGVTMGQAVLLLWHEVYLHSDDVRAAAGLPSVRGTGARGSVEYILLELQRRGWGPATLRLSGLPEARVGAGGRVIDGDPLQFILVATGRADADGLDLGAPVNVYLPEGRLPLS